MGFFRNIINALFGPDEDETPEVKSKTRVIFNGREVTDPEEIARLEKISGNVGHAFRSGQLPEGENSLRIEKSGTIDPDSPEGRRILEKILKDQE